MENSNSINESIMLFYSMIAEPKLSFDYYNRHHVDSQGKPFECRTYQVDYEFGMLLSDSIVIACGRSTSKSYTIAHIVFKWILTHPGLNIGMVVKNEVHSRGLIKYINDYFTMNEFMTQFFSVRFDGKNRMFHVSNGCTIEIRIAGSDKTGATTLVAGHFNLLIIDEAQLMYTTTLPEMLPMLKKGGKLIVTGVPNDLRERILYTYCTDEDTMYYKYTSIESVDWDEKKERDFLKMYKGGKDSVAWRQLVMACLPKGQKVVVPNGVKDISEIKEGDLVLTHKNRFRKVIKTHELLYEGPIHHIKQSYDSNELIITPEHPISIRKIKGKGKSRKKNDRYEELKFIPPTEIDKGDKIQFANISTINNQEEFQFNFETKGISWSKTRKKWNAYICYSPYKRKRFGYYKDRDTALLKTNIENWKYFKEEGYFNEINNRITITNELMFSLGLYLAEGHSNKYHITYSLHRNEIHLVDELNKFFIRKPSISYSKHDKSMQVTYGNKSLSAFFKSLIPGIASTKYINFDIFGLRDDFKISFLKGYFYGDGCRSINKGDLTYSCVTVSENMSYQLRLLLRSLNINTALTITKEGTSKINNKLYNTKKRYSLGIYGYWAYELDYLFGFTKTNEFNKKFQSKSDFEFYSNVISNDVKWFKGKVYNFDVEEDNSYVVFDSVVHNCWGDAASAVFKPSKLADNIREIDFNFDKFDVEKFTDLLSRLRLPIINKKYTKYIIGSDSGYTERSPMHISVLGEYTTKTKIDDELKLREHYDCVYRLEVSGMLSYEASKLIDYLLTYFNSLYCALDAQNYGASIYSNLVNRDIFPETASRNKKAILPVIFGDAIVTGRIKTIDVNTGKEIEVDEKKSIKCATTDKLVELNEKGLFHISDLDQGGGNFEDLFDILQCEIQTKSSTNNRLHPVVYSNTKNDHAVDSLRCAAFVIMQIIEKGIFLKNRNYSPAKPLKFNNHNSRRQISLSARYRNARQTRKF